MTPWGYNFVHTASYGGRWDLSSSCESCRVLIIKYVSFIEFLCSEKPLFNV